VQSLKDRIVCCHLEGFTIDLYAYSTSAQGGKFPIALGLVSLHIDYPACV
jgi:hypothetical protein